MELSQRTIDNIKDIREVYEKSKRIVDKSFIDYVIALLRYEDKLREHLNVIYDRKLFGIPAYVEFNDIHFNLKRFVRQSLGRALVWAKEFENTRVLEIQNLYALYGVLHEVMHIWQTVNCNENPELNRLYRNLFEATEDYSFYQAYLYNRHGLDFCFERNATLEAFRETARIYDKHEYREVAEANYMFLIDDYGYTTSPYEFTLQVSGLEDDYDFSALSAFEKLEHGLSVDKRILDEVSNISTLYAKELITYDEGLKKIKVLK